MKAVILAGGRGTRMRELTATVPKPMLKVQGKNLIEHKLEALPQEIREVVIVTGYLGDVIKDHFGDVFGRFKMEYAEQAILDGTAGALWQARDLLEGRFLVLMGDDIYDKEDMAELSTREWAVLARRASGIAVGGRIFQKTDGTLLAIREGTHEGNKLIMNAGAYALDSSIFQHEQVRLPDKAEYGLPQTIAVAAAVRPVGVVESRSWIQLSSPEDIESAEMLLRS